MKLNSLFFLVLFVGLLLTPTVVSFCDKQIDSTYFFSINEEENSKDLAHLLSFDKVEFLNSIIEIKILFLSRKTFETTKNSLSLCGFCFDTISPPPEIS